MSNFIDTGDNVIKLEHISSISKYDPYSSSAEDDKNIYHIQLCGNSLIIMHRDEMPRDELINLLKDINNFSELKRRG